MHQTVHYEYINVVGDQDHEATAGSKGSDDPGGRLLVVFDDSSDNEPNDDSKNNRLTSQQIRAQALQEISQREKHLLMLTKRNEQMKKASSNKHLPKPPMENPQSARSEPRGRAQWSRRGRPNQESGVDNRSVVQIEHGKALVIVPVRSAHNLHWEMSLYSTLQEQSRGGNFTVFSVSELVDQAQLSMSDQSNTYSEEMIAKAIKTSMSAVWEKTEKAAGAAMSGASPRGKGKFTKLYARRQVFVVVGLEKSTMGSNRAIECLQRTLGEMCDDVYRVDIGEEVQDGATKVLSTLARLLDDDLSGNDVQISPREQEHTFYYTGASNLTMTEGTTPKKPSKTSTGKQYSRVFIDVHSTSASEPAYDSGMNLRGSKPTKNGRTGTRNLSRRGKQVLKSSTSTGEAPSELVAENNGSQNYKSAETSKSPQHISEVLVGRGRGAENKKQSSNGPRVKNSTERGTDCNNRNGHKDEGKARTHKKNDNLNGNTGYKGTQKRDDSLFRAVSSGEEEEENYEEDYAQDDFDYPSSSKRSDI